MSFSFTHFDTEGGREVFIREKYCNSDKIIYHCRHVGGKECSGGNDNAEYKLCGIIDTAKSFYFDKMDHV